MGSKRFVIKSSDCKIQVFLFLVQLLKRKCDLEKPHNHRIYNKNTIDFKLESSDFNGVFIMVEARGIEPLSENADAGPSPSAVSCFYSPLSGLK